MLIHLLAFSPFDFPDNPDRGGHKAESNTCQRSPCELLMTGSHELPVSQATLAGELQEREHNWKRMHNSSVRNELKRIANSRWGSRLIRLAFSLRLNRLFH